VALQLRKIGIVRVRPLLGGLEAWLALRPPAGASAQHVPAQSEAASAPASAPSGD